MLQYMQRIMLAMQEDGASAVEYGLLVAAIAAVIVVIVFALGGVIKNAFCNTCSAISASGAGSRHHHRLPASRDLDSAGAWGRHSRRRDPATPSPEES